MPQYLLIYPRPKSSRLTFSPHFFDPRLSLLPILLSLSLSLSQTFIPFGYATLPSSLLSFNQLLHSI